MIRTYVNGAVELYHNNAKTLYTNTTGASIKGGNTGTETELKVYGNEGQRAILMLAADDGDDNADYWQFQARTDGNLNIQNYNGGSWVNSLILRGGGAAELYHNNSKKFETTSAGAHCHGNLDFFDNHKVRLGTSSDLQIYFDGTVGHIKGISGVQNINVATSNVERYQFTDGSIRPLANNTYDLGTSSLRWQNIYTNDLNLSNEGGANDVDGTWGSYTIQEGAEDLFLVNKRSGKKYKFNLTEVS